MRDFLQVDHIGIIKSKKKRQLFCVNVLNSNLDKITYLNDK